MQVAQKGKLLPKKKGKGGVWKDDEFDRLLEAIRLFGKDWAQVSQYVGTRDRAQVCMRAHRIKADIKEKGSKVKGGDLLPILAGDLRVMRKAGKSGAAKDKNDTDSEELSEMEQKAQECEDDEMSQGELDGDLTVDQKPNSA